MQVFLNTVDGPTTAIVVLLQVLQYTAQRQQGSLRSPARLCTLQSRTVTECSGVVRAPRQLQNLTKYLSPAHAKRRGVFTEAVAMADAGGGLNSLVRAADHPLPL
eukprot:1118748-Pleurochrysis_carterae.AAC.1